MSQTINTPLQYYICIVFSLFFIACEGPGQLTKELDDISTYPDAYLEAYTNTEEVLERLSLNLSEAKQVDSLVFLTKLLKNYADNAALTYANEAYQLAFENDWKTARAVSAYYLAVLKGENVSYGESIEDALVDARISQRLFGQLDNPTWKAKANSLLGYLYNRQSKQDSAKVYLFQTLEDLKNPNIKPQLIAQIKGEVYHDLANLFFSTDTLQAYQYVYKSDSLFSITQNDTKRIALWLALSKFYKSQKQYTKADSLYQQCITLAKKTKDYEILGRAYNDFGLLKSRQYDKTGKEVYFNQAIDYLKKAQSYQSNNLYHTYLYLGIAYQMRSYWTITYENSLDSTLYYYKLSMIEARKEGALNITKTLGGNIATLCDWINTQQSSMPRSVDCEKIFGTSTSNFLYTNYSGIVDSLTRSARIAFQRTNAIEQRELKAVAERNRQRQLFIAGGILMASLFIFIVLLQRQQQKRLLAKMEALRAQINPHFISNSLNAIESLVNLDKKEAAAKYIIHFSRLARRILNNSREPMTTLAGELQTLKHFLALEQLRFRDKLSFDIQIDPDLQTENIEIPAMILQPYLENAIWHGIKPKPDKGLLTISIKRSGKFLDCIIEDDGIGRVKAAELKAASVLKQTSMGTQITEERLRMTKVKGAKVEIIDLRKDGHAAGTRVILRLPFRLRKKSDSTKTKNYEHLTRYFSRR